MASQGQQKLRRNPSPSCLKQGPLKATKAFGLKASPSASPTAQWPSDSHRKTRRSPDHRASPDRNSPCSPGFKEKGKMRYSPVASMKRTNSLDTITTPYLKGEWPKDPIVPYQQTSPAIGVTSQQQQYIHSSTCDKFTQTEDEWEEKWERKHKKSHKRSSSAGGDEKLKEKIKARLAKCKEGSKNIGTGQARISPVQGNHYAVTSAPVAPQSKAVAIQHIPKSPYKIIGSLEGLNQEIERLNLVNFSGTDEGDCRQNLAEDTTPDGHRAPVLELLHPGTRNADTQTPSGISEHLEERPIERTYSSESSSSQPSSRSTSESPSLPIIPVPGQHDSPRAKSSTDSTGKLLQNKEDKDDGESPNPNKCEFVREPPDGCEKIKIVEETRRTSTDSADIQLFCPIKKPLENFHIPSHSSAFCPLMKSYVPQGAAESHTSLKVNSPSKDRDLFTSSPIPGIEGR